MNAAQDFMKLMSQIWDDDEEAALAVANKLGVDNYTVEDAFLVAERMFKAKLEVGIGNSDHPNVMFARFEDDSSCLIGSAPGSDAGSAVWPSGAPK